MFWITRMNPVELSELLKEEEKGRRVIYRIVIKEGSEGERRQKERSERQEPDTNLTSCCWLWQWKKVPINQGMQTASRSWEWPHLTASKEMGTSVPQLLGMKFCQQLKNHERNEAERGFTPRATGKNHSPGNTLILVLSDSKAESHCTWTLMKEHVRE